MSRTIGLLYPIVPVDIGVDLAARQLLDQQTSTAVDRHWLLPKSSLIKRALDTRLSSI